MTDTSLLDLAAVLAIARCRSFRAAALELGRSTTALSSAIARLEASLGVRLFNRTTRSVSLSDAGRAFVEQTGPALEVIRQAMATARAQRATPAGTLRINTFATAARAILSPLVLTFVGRYPEVHVDIVTEGKLVDIVAQGFDLGVRPADLVPADMIAVPLGRPERHVIVGSTAYLTAHPAPRTPAELAAHRCVRGRLPGGALLRWELRRGRKVVHVDVQGPLTLDEASVARMAVLAGVGLGYFMEADVRADIDAGRLLRVLDSWTPELPGLCLYYPSRRNASAALRAFVALARELAAERPHGRAAPPA
ncbi:MAG: LysR family transcriptional regulator [Myxococcales bacterium]|nr:LysR family transcriptional regulator [Myxococcales bacterium]